jgi:hypothetical protein
MTQKLAEKIAAAKAEVARLERSAHAATCAEMGHDMRSIGGCNAGCDDACGCSVPVHECAVCGDCDYGVNDEAAEVRRRCELTR